MIEPIFLLLTANYLPSILAISSARFIHPPWLAFALEISLSISTHIRPSNSFKSTSQLSVLVIVFNINSKVKIISFYHSALSILRQFLLRYVSHGRSDTHRDTPSLAYRSSVVRGGSHRPVSSTHDRKIRYLRVQGWSCFHAFSRMRERLRDRCRK